VIDSRYRAIFIHQRKVAGISIKFAFGFESKKAEWDAYNDGVLSPGWAERDSSYFVFSAVRNPFDRLISSWKFLDPYRGQSLLSVLRDPPSEGHPYRHLTRPQIAILKDPQTNKLVTDDLIRFESLQSDFDRICDRIGKPRVKLPHLNRSRRFGWYRPYFDREARRLAEELFAEDLAAFDYRF